jgi:hypothetical protein
MAQEKVIFRVLPPGDLWQADGADFRFLGSFTDEDAAIEEAKRLGVLAGTARIEVGAPGTNPGRTLHVEGRKS